eukprot:CCRYP_010989-RA/>CCRYP_010989-RA protein AED:0.49 eAED:1.00 QI:0/-1/0/1/-1/0/1/0/60
MVQLQADQAYQIETFLYKGYNQERGGASGASAHRKYVVRYTDKAEARGRVQKRQIIPHER